MLGIFYCISQIIKRFKKTTVLIINLPRVTSIFYINFNFRSFTLVLLNALASTLHQIVPSFACNALLWVKGTCVAIRDWAWFASWVGRTVVFIIGTIFLILNIFDFALSCYIVFFMTISLTADWRAVLFLFAIFSNYWNFPETWLTLIIVLILDLAGQGSDCIYSIVYNL